MMKKICKTVCLGLALSMLALPMVGCEKDPGLYAWYGGKMDVDNVMSIHVNGAEGEKVYDVSFDTYRTVFVYLKNNVSDIIMNDKGEATALSTNEEKNLAIKEVAEDTGKPVPLSGNLDRWAEQGVLMLNSVLTVRAHEAASHAGRGWEKFTDAVVRSIAEKKQGVVYMLWGSYAQKKGAMVNPSQNLVLKAVHPSPLSVYRGFFGSRHFSKANDYLMSIGKSPIEW